MSTRSAIPAPDRDERRIVGRSIARARSNAHTASPVANTASLEAWWYSVAYAGYTSSRSALKSAGMRPKTSAVALHARIETCVEDSEDELEQPDAAEIERKPDDERRERRAEQLELGERRIGVEELQVVREVVPRVATLGHRPPERLDPVDDERDREQCDAARRVGTNASSRCHARVTRALREVARATRSSGRCSRREIRASRDRRSARRTRGRGPTPGAPSTRPRTPRPRPPSAVHRVRSVSEAALRSRARADCRAGACRRRARPARRRARARRRPTTSGA